MGLTVGAKLVAKEQKPGLAMRRESVSLCWVLGGLPCKMVSPTRALSSSRANTLKVQVTESGSHEKISAFSKKVKVVFPSFVAIAKEVTS